MKRKVCLLMALTVILMAFGCDKKINEDALKFKNDYESLNGKTTASNREYRMVIIDENNPFVYSTCEEIVSLIKEGKQDFVVYFGANWCPWCRSIVETFIQTAKLSQIDKVYYVDVRPENLEENEIRNVYAKKENGEIYRSHEGTAAYNEFIEIARDFLSDYSRSDVESLAGTIWEGEKRVGAPNFFLIKAGKVVQMTTGVSELQESAYSEMNDDIVNDITSKFNSLFSELRKKR